MAEGPERRLGQAREERDDVVHEVLVVDDAVLTLLHQRGHEVAEVGPEVLPLLPGPDQRVFARFLGKEAKGRGSKKQRRKCLRLISVLRVTSYCRNGLLVRSICLRELLRTAN